MRNRLLWICLLLVATSIAGTASACERSTCPVALGAFDVPAHHLEHDARLDLGLLSLSELERDARSSIERAAPPVHLGMLDEGGDVARRVMAQGELARELLRAASAGVAHERGGIVELPDGDLARGEPAAVLLEPGDHAVVLGHVALLRDDALTEVGEPFGEALGTGCGGGFVLPLGGLGAGACHHQQNSCEDHHLLHGEMTSQVSSSPPAPSRAIVRRSENAPAGIVTEQPGRAVSQTGPVSSSPQLALPHEPHWTLTGFAQFAVCLRHACCAELSASVVVPVYPVGSIGESTFTLHAASA